MAELKPIPGYEGLYSASSDGRIWSYWTNKFLSLAVQPTGYLRVCLYDGDVRKHLFVHRLVLMAWKGKDALDGKETNHKDRNKENNCIDNLEVCTHSENLIHALRNGHQAVQGSRNGRAKLNERRVKQIKRLLAHGVEQADIASQFGVTQPAVSLINTGRSWGHVEWPSP